MARVSRGKFHWLRDRYRRIVLDRLFKRNIELQMNLDSLTTHPNPEAVKQALEEMGKLKSFQWLEEEFLVIVPTKLTDAQIAAFDKPLDQQRKMLTDNPKLNALLERPVRWSER